MWIPVHLSAVCTVRVSSIRHLHMEPCARNLSHGNWILKCVLTMVFVNKHDFLRRWHD